MCKIKGRILMRIGTVLKPIRIRIRNGSNMETRIWIGIKLMPIHNGVSITRPISGTLSPIYFY